MINQEIHVVSSPDLMPYLHRKYKAISLWQLEGRFTAQLAGLSESARDRLLENLLFDSDTSSLMIKGIKVIQVALSPLGGMKKMLQVAALATKDRLDDQATPARNNRTDLFEWVRHELTMVTTESLYGVRNPYRDPNVEAGFWSFAEGSMNLLLPDFLSNIIATKALRGRYTVEKGFRRYFSTGAYLSGSELTKERYELLVDKTDGSHKDLAKHETLNDIAVLSNTIPTAFWAIFHAFSDARLLEKIRTQVEEITTSEVSPQGTIRRINLEKLNQLPILSSMILETLRFRSTGTGPRLVMEDTFVGSDQYLLKKDSVVIIANRRLHFDKNVWGETADSFRPDRFCSRVPANGFRAFGGGVNKCPGQAFVTPLMVAFIAMLAMRFEIIPYGDEWADPGQDLSNMSAQIAPPKKKFMVDMIPREGMKDMAWSFDV
ncbi:255a591b-6fe0-4c8d-8609-9114f4f524bb [Sclerotinia trifoliorum]|uniref:255a591b-6fe0-4c8d-8609-9114f4f524bb n=1 Tax=Sclerotinia trifoliorum TaxID=28548 RepID=A0A8H2ZKX6_9HELO|nr:255a591b-6fe0-4c8d-8609-9114f4f524bb [Sclerotinia trifoliorum]